MIKKKISPMFIFRPTQKHNNGKITVSLDSIAILQPNFILNLYTV